jgi:two-component system, NarL family, response regulator NreC
MVRESLGRLLDESDACRLVAEAVDARDLLRLAQQHEPQIAVVSAPFESADLSQLVRDLIDRCPATSGVILGSTDARCDIAQLLRAGIRGYVSKQATSAELIGAIQTVASGKLYVDPRAIGKLISRPGPAGDGTRLTELSGRETEVIRLIALGFSNKEIAAQLRLSAKTIETYKARAMEKLRLRSRVDLVRTAFEPFPIRNGTPARMCGSPARALERFTGSRCAFVHLSPCVFGCALRAVPDGPCRLGGFAEPPKIHSQQGGILVRSRREVQAQTFPKCHPAGARIAPPGADRPADREGAAMLEFRGQHDGNFHPHTRRAAFTPAAAPAGNPRRATCE